MYEVDFKIRIMFLSTIPIKVNQIFPEDKYKLEEYSWIIGLVVIAKSNLINLLWMFHHIAKNFATNIFKTNNN